MENITNVEDFIGCCQVCGKLCEFDNIDEVFCEEHIALPNFNKLEDSINGNS